MVELAQILMKGAKKDVPLNHAEARAGEQRRSVVSIDKAKAGLGWAPEVSIEEGLRRTYDWFANR